MNKNYGTEMALWLSLRQMRDGLSTNIAHCVRQKGICAYIYMSIRDYDFRKIYTENLNAKDREGVYTSAYSN